MARFGDQRPGDFRRPGTLRRGRFFGVVDTAQRFAHGCVRHTEHPSKGAGSHAIVMKPLGLNELSFWWAHAKDSCFHTAVTQIGSDSLDMDSELVGNLLLRHAGQICDRDLRTKGYLLIVSHRTSHLCESHSPVFAASSGVLGVEDGDVDVDIVVDDDFGLALVTAQHPADALVQ